MGGDDDPFQDQAPAAAEPGSVSDPLPANQDETDKDFNRQTFDHVRSGLPSDNIVYVNDQGMRVKLDRRGSQYSVDIDGVRNTKKSARPVGMEPELWRQMGPDRAKLIGQAKPPPIEPAVAPPDLVDGEDSPTTQVVLHDGVLQSGMSPGGVIPPGDNDGAETDGSTPTSDGWQVVRSRQSKKSVPNPQPAPVEGSLIKLEVIRTARPNAGGCLLFIQSVMSP